MFSNQKNKWNLGVKSNFENFEFWVVLISKSILVTSTARNFQKLGLVLCMVFNQQFEFWVMLNTKFALFMTTVYQFEKIREI